MERWVIPHFQGWNELTKVATVAVLAETDIPPRGGGAKELLRAPTVLKSAASIPAAVR